ncbi:uncharacterized protein LOC117172807 isoform X2 [Belonocnema kinseyi]|uniref:uncharacterized protein LOC117172807 isoform X2 n=1 Tax=Belonocnema kinseyi TaxID=2817044 RepID=UPI00143DD691|nr:uncharacterized protein LOC117172807 isoform X2 [Belonocnema kinseyi]
MKTFVAVLGICIVGILAETTDEENTSFGAVKNTCIKEVGFDSDTLEKTMKEKLEKNDEKLGCLFACISKKLGLMNSDGFIDESKLPRVRGVSDKEKADMIRNKCKVMRQISNLRSDTNSANAFKHC